MLRMFVAFIVSTMAFLQSDFAYLAVVHLPGIRGRRVAPEVM
jgi:hypothetical protein